MFITFIGFVNAKFIVDNLATLVAIAKMNPIIITFLVGLIITSILVIKRVKAALIIGITTTILSIPIGRIYGDASAISYGVSTLVTWKGLISMPDFSVLLNLDFVESIKLSLFPVIFALLFTDMFDSLSTFIGVAEASNLVDENGEPGNIRKSLIVDAVSTTIPWLFGTSSGNQLESATGVEQGGRTGMTAVVTWLLFLPFLFFSPLLSMIPAIATAPALVLVGVFMMKPVLKINWTKFDDAIPAFFGMILIPLTYSITQGIIWSFISWTIIKVAVGKKDEITPMLIAIDILAILALSI